MSGFAAIVVTYNSAGVLDACLRSLGSTPVMVVDNASADDSCAIAATYRSVHLISNTTNRGFAAAVNQAVASCDADAFVLLNPDAEIFPGTLEAIGKIPHDLAGGRLVDSDGQDQAGFGIRRFPLASSLIFEVLGLNRLFPWNSVNTRYRYLDQDWNQAGLVEQPAGAFLYFRREVWERTGGFDEEFQPIWFEDVDFCFRAYHMGFRAVYEPGLMVRHLGGHSIQPLSRSSRAAYWYASLLRYASKHFRPVSRRGVCVAVIVGAVPRLVLDSVRQRSFQPVGAYTKAIRLAVRSLFSPAFARPALAMEGTSRIRG